ncbi:uncharacterized protein CG45076 isoform X4 [Bactrocera dorsalis]|uniref:Uncharacterized protein CG45076 isoform X4 n=1 Tax=Bactrocera dorsalis TaxID=27457 RepID=A0ABM3J557_BACDO|nr:uncharacterized protein CG45076 isoform X4 [Bactrocera dorsalis]
MVYESGFTTRRTYTSRPIISSYAVSYPFEHKVSRVYKTTYPIYSSYTIPKRVYTGARIYTSPVRVVTSPARVVTRVIHSPSPIRVVRTTTRVISSPERTMSYTYKTPKIYNSSYLPATTYSSYLPSTYVYSTPSYYYSPISRVFTRSLSPPIRITSSPVRSTTSYLKRTLPGYGARALTNYLNTEPFAAFQDETNRIRHRAQSLIRDIHSPVLRRSRSCTPFPVTGYTYEPTSKLALDAYVERITNPVRHVAKEVHRISHYPEPAKKYVGKSHLASVRICGDKAYNIRRPMYDSDKVRTDINLLSWYLRNPLGKGDEKSKENYSEKADPDLDPYRPSRKFSTPPSLDDPVGEETKEKQRLRHERLMTVSEEVLDEIQLEKKKALITDELREREQKGYNFEH